MTELALLGGSPVISTPFKPFRTMGPGEVAAVQAVVESDCLSGFYGSWGDEFLGGPKIREFEAAWAEAFQVKHCISVNSATSGLYAALGAIGLTPGDEVIVPPYTMSASAVGPLIYGGIPVFADIEPETFCLDIASVEANITEKTKAIVVVNLFGHPAQLHARRALAEKHGIILIEDNAQGPFATENGVFAGTIGHIGVFSLNYHKHIHTGEGGMCVTNDDRLALRMQMIRNHAENIVGPTEHDDLSNMIGFNYRMTELSAAVGIVQLQRQEELIGQRVHIAQRLTEGTKDLEGFTPPVERDGCRHVYYVWTPKIDPATLGISREVLVKALAAEGVPLYPGYVRPLYLLPAFQQRMAMGRNHFPFTLTNRVYARGLCPVAEEMHFHRLLAFETCAHTLTDADVDAIIEGIRKVHAQRHKLIPQAAE